MALHALGWLATLLLAAHQCSAQTRLSLVLLATALVLLLAAQHVVYATFALVLGLLATGISRWRPGSLALRLCFYTVSCWFLPIVSTWGVSMQFGEELFSQEVGHLFQTTFEFLVLFLVPLVAMRLHPTDPLRLQRSESIALLVAGFVGGSVEAGAIFWRDRDKEGWSPVNDYQHVLHAFTWGTFGLLGLAAAAHGHKTDLHVGGAAAVFGAGMLMHTEAATGADKYILAWVLMHVASAVLFLAGGALRLTGKVGDAACAFFVGAVYFTFSARQVSHSIADHFPSGMAAVLAVLPVSVAALATHWHVLHTVLHTVRRHAPGSRCGPLEPPKYGQADTRPIISTQGSMTAADEV
jgi:hypothetical protein